MNKKIAIIGTVGLPAKYGGFETLTEYLTQHLSEKYDLTVYCSSKSYDKQTSRYNGAKLCYIPLNANGIQSIPYDIISIIKALRYADTLLILGVSGSIALPIAKLFSNKKIIVNIDGLEWKREKWNKFAKWFLKLSELLAVKMADVIVTDNRVIQDYVKAKYAKNSRLIAYGADHVQKIKQTQELLHKYTFLQKSYAFTVCRIEPENNLHIILEAMSQQQVLQLVIIGNWNASKYGRNLVIKYNGYKNIHLLNPIYKQEVLNQIRSNCTIYLHGHSAGGTNPSLVEAMYLGLPIFSYAAHYNKETTEYDACYFSVPKELTQLIETSGKDTLNSIGKKMANIAHVKYRWKDICQQYIDIL